MKTFAILCITPGWHCEQILSAFERRGAAARFVTADALVSTLGVPGAQAELSRYNGLVIRGIPAGSLEQVIYRMDALFALERGGLPCVNPPKTIEKTVDKYLTSALLVEAGLPVPPTICCENAEAARAAFSALGGDVVYKPLFGSCGNGLMRLTNEREAEEAFSVIAETGGIFYLQKFVESGNSDLRAFVIGGRVVAAMRRTGMDWRANISRGGTAAPYVLNAYEEALALSAARAVEADVAGVDLLISSAGETYVTEVNGCPGWHGLSTVTDADIAGEIVSLMLSKT